MEVLLKAEEVVLLARLADINKVERNVLSTYIIICQVLARTDIHAPIHLPAVCADDFSVAQTGSEVGGKRRLAGSRGAKDGDERHSHRREDYNLFASVN